MDKIVVICRMKTDAEVWILWYCFRLARPADCA